MFAHHISGHVQLRLALRSWVRSPPLSVSTWPAVVYHCSVSTLETPGWQSYCTGGSARKNPIPKIPVWNPQLQNARVSPAFRNLVPLSPYQFPRRLPQVSLQVEGHTHTDCQPQHRNLGKQGFQVQNGMAENLDSEYLEKRKRSMTFGNGNNIAILEC